MKKFRKVVKWDEGPEHIFSIIIFLLFLVETLLVITAPNSFFIGFIYCAFTIFIIWILSSVAGKGKEVYWEEVK